MALSPHYVIPKKSIQYFMKELTSKSPAQQEMIDIFYNSFKSTQQSRYHIEALYNIENAELIANYLSVRSQLRLSSQPSALGPSFNYGFIEVPDLQQAEMIAKSGVVVRRHASYNSIYLGTEVNGVFLSLCGDFTCKDKPVPESSHFIVICRLALSQECVKWLIPVIDRNEQPPPLPRDRDFGANTYINGRHLAVCNMCQPHQDSEWVESFEAGLIYLWDHDAQFRPRLSPRHCLPIAVINYRYQGEGSHASILPPSCTQVQPNLYLSQHSPGSSLDATNHYIRKGDSPSPSTLFQTKKLPFDALLNTPQLFGQMSGNYFSHPPTPSSNPKIPASILKRFREATLLASEIWSGMLCNGNNKLCPITLRTYYPPSFSLHFSASINIDLATNLDLFYKEFPQGLFSDAYPMLRDPKLPSPLVIKNNSIHYVEVCPNGGAAISVLNTLISHLQEKSEVAYAYIDEVTVIYFMPTSPLTHHLKLTHQAHPSILHALIYRLLPPVLSSTGVSTSPIPDANRVVHPIPTRITSCTSGDNSCNNIFVSAGPYPYLLQRVPMTTTRAIGIQCSPPPSCRQCRCKTSTYIDASSQTSLDTREQAF